MASNDTVKWKRARDDEMESMYVNDTGSLVHNPGGRLCDNRWVYKKKYAFVGYGVYKKGVRFYNPRSRSVITVRGCTFLRQVVAYVQVRNKSSSTVMDNEKVTVEPVVVPTVMDNEMENVVVPLQPTIVVNQENRCDLSLSSVMDSRLRSQVQRDSSGDEYTDAGKEPRVSLRFRGSVLVHGMVAEDEKEIHEMIEHLKQKFMVKTHGGD